MIGFCFLESLGGWPRSVSGRLGLYLNKFVTLFNHKRKVQLILISTPFFHSPNILKLLLLHTVDQYYVWFSLCVILAMVFVVCYSRLRMVFVACYSIAIDQYYVWFSLCVFLAVD